MVQQKAAAEQGLTSHLRHLRVVTDGHPDPFGSADKRPQTTAGDLGVNLRDEEDREPRHIEIGVHGKHGVKDRKRGYQIPGLKDREEILFLYCIELYSEITFKNSPLP